MKLIKMVEVQLIQGYHQVTFSPNGKYVVILKEHNLRVIEFEESSSSRPAKYVLKDHAFSIDQRYRIACFEDYIVHLQISGMNESKLSLLRFDFRTAATFRLELPFQTQITSNEAKLPSNAAKIFKTAFSYFEDIRLRDIFQLNSIILESTKYDFQVTGGNNQLLLPYKHQIPSPFTMPYLIKQRDYMNVVIIKSKRYQAGRISQTRLLFQGNRYDYHYLNQFRYILSTLSEIKIFQKTKMIRKFVSDKLELVETNENYVLAKEGGSNYEFTFRFDIRTAKRVVIAKYQDVIMRGRFLFSTIYQDSRPSVFVGLDQDAQYVLKEYFVQLLKVYKIK